MPWLPPTLLREALARGDGVLFIGGQDYPSALYDELPHPQTEPLHAMRAASDLELFRAAFASPTPILGICGGHQLLNIACGGKLIQHLPQAEAHGGEKNHGVTIHGGRILRELFGEKRIEVNSHHHQAVDPDAIGRGLIVTARADDGVVEALEGTDSGRFLLGVQWHPERYHDLEQRRKIMAAFVAACADKVKK